MSTNTLVKIVIVLTFGTYLNSEIDGKYYALNRDVCKDGNYWECYSNYLELNYKENFLFHHRPSLPTSECGRVFKIEDGKLILGTMNSFQDCDTLTIEFQTENEIIFSIPNGYPKWLNRIIKVPESNADLELLISKTIGKEQKKGFYNFNQILLDERLFSKEEILQELQNPNFKELAKYDVIRLNYPKKWNRKVGRELKRLLKE